MKTYDALTTMFQIDAEHQPPSRDRYHGCRARSKRARFPLLFWLSSTERHLVAAGTVTTEAAAALDRLGLGDGDDVDGDGVELLRSVKLDKAGSLPWLACVPDARAELIVGGKTYAEVLEEVLGLGVDIELTALGVLGEVESGDLGNVLILALTLLLLQLEGDTADGATLDTLHQVSGVAGNLLDTKTC